MHCTARTSRLLAGLLFALVVAACGGGDGAAPVTPPVGPIVPPVVPPVAGPTASFTSASTATANGAVAFDASASVSADGSALLYSWDFGDGQRGGGKTIAHMFANAGAPTVTLTVVDGSARQGTAARTITVAAGPAPGSNVAAHALIKDPDGVVVAGVAIAQAGTAATLATTDAMGRADLTLASSAPLTMKLTKAGYADQFVALQLPAGAGTDTLFEATLRPRDAALTLADAHAGGTLAGRAGATITLPADALVSSGGTLATGAVQIAMTPVDVTLPGAGGFPGRFEGVTPDGATTPIVSFGTVEFVLSSGVERLQLAAGKTATIEVPIWAAMQLDGSVLAVGDTTPLWSLDEATSMWIQEGTGTVVASAASPSGLAMRATVSHFSWWNSDHGFAGYGPKPRCVYDTDSGVPGGLDTFATATVCNMLAEMDRGLGGAAAASRRRAQAARQAAFIPPQIAGFAARAVLPIAGGERMVVPAGYNVVLRAGALNGTWGGQLVVNGAVAVEEEVLVKMRPLFITTGPAPETIVPPFDGTRALPTGQIARFTFDSGAFPFARITVSQGNGSTLTGQVRLLQGTTALASATFDTANASIVTPLPAVGSYTIEVEGLTNTPGAYRLQVDLLGVVQAETVAYPFDVTKSLPAFGAYRGSFDVAAAGYAHFAFKPIGNKVQLRVLGPTGTVVYANTSGSNIYGNAQTIAITLPAAGRYTSEVLTQDGSKVDFELTGEPTSWLAIAPGLDADSLFAMIDLVADRNGMPVVGYIRTPIVNQTTTQSLLLRRWTGTAWETVGSDISIALPCNSHDVASFAFDSTNAPVIVYSSNNASNGSVTTALRFGAGAWQPVGPNGGALPNSGVFNGACSRAPKLVLDAADRPLVAYQVDNALWLQRFDNNAWSGLATPLGDSFPFIFGDFDLRLDAGGVPWFVHATESGTTVRRFDAATTAWVGVGPNGGRLSNSGFTAPRLRFDATGTPVIGAIVPVGSVVFSAGVAVYRFDGSTWVTTGGFQTRPGSYVVNTGVPAFTLAGGEALMAWDNATNSTNSSAVVVQRNTPSGWMPVGSGAGEVVQYAPHGITPDQSPLDPRLLSIGSDVYLVLVVAQIDGTRPFKVMLLKKAGG